MDARRDQRADASSVVSGISSEFHSTVLSPADRHGDDSLSNSPMSFHTPNNEGDSDYQNDIDENVDKEKNGDPKSLCLPKVDYALGSSPPDERQSSFYSDGRPRPLGEDDSDDDSRHSNDEAGYVTATQPSMSRMQPPRFVDPYQPKLLLAEDSIEPADEKTPLANGYEPAMADRPRMSSPDDHEELHREHHHSRKSRRDVPKSGRSRGKGNEATPLLRDQSYHDDDRDSGCCLLL